MAKAERDFIELMQLNDPANAGVFFSGKSVPIARGMTEDNARALQRKLGAIGMVAVVKADTQAAKNTSKSTAKRRHRQNARKRKRKAVQKPHSAQLNQTSAAGVATASPNQKAPTPHQHGKVYRPETADKSAAKPQPKLSSPFAPRNTYALTPYRITPALRNRAHFSRYGALAAGTLTVAMLIMMTLTLLAPDPQAPNWGIDAIAPGPHDQVLVLADNSLALYQNAEPRLEVSSQALGLQEVGTELLVDDAGEVLLSAISASKPVSPPWQVMRCNLVEKTCRALSALSSSSKPYILARNVLTGINSIANTVTHSLYSLDKQDAIAAQTRLNLHPNAELHANDGLLFISNPENKTLSVLRPDKNAFGQRLETLSIAAKESESLESLKRCNGHWWALLGDADTGGQRLLKLDDQLGVLQRQNVSNARSLACFNDLLLLTRHKQQQVTVLNKDGEPLPPMTFSALAKRFDSQHRAHQNSIKFREQIKRWSCSGLLLSLFVTLFFAVSARVYHVVSTTGAPPVEMVPPKAYWLGTAPHRRKTLSRMLAYYTIGATVILMLSFAVLPEARFSLFTLLVAAGVALWWYRDSNSGNMGMYRNTVVLISPYQSYNICKSDQLTRWGPFIMAEDIVVFLGHPYLPNLRKAQFNAARRRALNAIPNTDLATVLVRLLWSLHPIGLALLLLPGALVLAPLLWM